MEFTLKLNKMSNWKVKYWKDFTRCVLVVKQLAANIANGHPVSMNLSVPTFLKTEIVPAAQEDAQKNLTIEQIN